MSNKIEYPSYANISAKEPLEQGDFILDCQIAHPTFKAEKENQTINVDFIEYDVIVMSQSCDLQSNKIELVLVCPFCSLTEYGNIDPLYKKAEWKEKLRKGHVFGAHILHECEINGNNDFLVVDFKSVYAVPLTFLKQIVSSKTDRKRLLPPYREHLSQAFARFFMRVGLPVDIPAFK